MNVKEQKGRYLSPEFSAFFDSILSGLKSEQAKKNYRSRVYDITEKCGKDFLALTKEDVQEYFSTVCDRKNTTTSVRLAILRAVAGKADDHFGASLKNNFFNLGVDPSLKKLSLSSTPKLSEIDSVLKRLKENNDRQTFLAITLALETALSTGEIASLDFGNCLEDKNGTPFLKLASGSGEDFFRYIPLKSGTMQLISDIAKDRGSISGTSPIFLNNTGKRMSERTMQQNVKKAFEDAGIAGGPSSISSIGTLARALILKGGATTQALSKQLDVTGLWFFRLNDIVKELDTAASNYNHVEVKW